MALSRYELDRDLARRLVEGAGREVERLLASDVALRVSAKENPTDLVTTADVAAECFVVDLLARERPDDGVLGEEGTVRSGTTGRTWVIDPVDGTYNFNRGSDRWCSAIALVDSGGPVLGAVAHPARHEVTLGGPGWGVIVAGGHQDETVLPPLVERDLPECSLLTYLHPTFHTGDVGEVWRRLVAGVATLRMTGSGSLDAVDVVRGRADLVVQHSVPDWDRLPGEALLRGVGGDARQITAAGVEWYVAGNVRAVAQACALLADG